VSDLVFHRLIGNDLLRKPTAHPVGVSPSSVRSFAEMASAPSDPVGSVEVGSTKVVVLPGSRTVEVVEVTAATSFRFLISTIVDSWNSFRDELVGAVA
jgi:hypothetical protein